MCTPSKKKAMDIPAADYSRTLIIQTPLSHGANNLPSVWISEVMLMAMAIAMQLAVAYLICMPDNQGFTVHVL